MAFYLIQLNKPVVSLYVPIREQKNIAKLCVSFFYIKALEILSFRPIDHKKLPAVYRE